MPEKEIVCIGCPMGCSLQVSVRDNKVASVRGNVCARGVQYAKDEVINPKRMVTSLIRVPDHPEPLSVRTSEPIPKNQIFACLAVIRQTKVTLPVKIGDVVIENVLGTGVDIVATRHLEAD